ncbi:MAG: copper homeostasis protein CutC [Erysipelotrichaceae bacterium]|nr:copper homeostasis protein CutC [Erysipelotrichaceae bacterium]
MKLEIVTQTADETKYAHELGADRVELVSAITEGALTPTFGSVKTIKETIHVPAFCMIRPHPYSFIYSENDLKEMQNDIINQLPYASAFVLGCLDENDEIDETKLAQLLSVVGTTPVTFHKAIDKTPDFRKSVLTLAKYPQVKRVLTNFGIKDVAANANLISEQLAFCKQHGLTVTFAGGVNLASLPILKAAGVEEVHISSAARIGGLAKNQLDPDTIRAMSACK